MSDAGGYRTEMHDVHTNPSATLASPRHHPRSAASRWV